MKKELPAIQKAYDLSKEVLKRASNFPRDYRFSLGDRVTENTLGILEVLIQAAYSNQKLPQLNEANIRLEKLRFLLRLCRELGVLSHGGYEYVMRMVTELGMQVGGWRKQVSQKQ